MRAKYSKQLKIVDDQMSEEQLADILPSTQWQDFERTPFTVTTK